MPHFRIWPFRVVWTTVKLLKTITRQFHAVQLQRIMTALLADRIVLFHVNLSARPAKKKSQEQTQTVGKGPALFFEGCILTWDRLMCTWWSWIWHIVNCFIDIIQEYCTPIVAASPPPTATSSEEHDLWRVGMDQFVRGIGLPDAGWRKFVCYCVLQWFAYMIWLGPFRGANFEQHGIHRGQLISVYICFIFWLWRILRDFQQISTHSSKFACLLAKHMPGPTNCPAKPAQSRLGFGF